MREFIAGYYLAVAIHELGHLLTGKLVGMEIGGIMIGGLSVFKSGDRWAWRFDPRLILGGWAAPLPLKLEDDRSKFAWMVAAGPLASLAWIVFVEAIQIRSEATGSAWPSNLLLSAFIVLVFSLIPGTAGSTQSDSVRLWTLLRQPERSRRWTALVALLRDDAQGTRPRDLSPNLISVLLDAAASEPEYATHRWLAMYHAEDLRDNDAALQHLEDALANSQRASKPMRHVMFLCAAYASAARGSSEKARVWLRRAKQVRRPESTSAVEGQIACCEGRYADAQAHFAEALAFLERSRLDSGMARYSKEKLTQCVEHVINLANTTEPGCSYPVADGRAGRPSEPLPAFGTRPKVFTHSCR